MVYAQEVEFPIPDSQRHGVRIRPEVPELFFCRDLAGYGWCFRKEHHLNIGLGRVGPQDLSVQVAEFCKFLRLQRKVTCDMPDHFHGHAYQICDRADADPFATGVLLTGDAAGLAYPLSGEGIRPAVESGLLAADVILRAEGDYDRERLTPYGASLPSVMDAIGCRACWIICRLPGWREPPRLGCSPQAGSRRHVVMNGWFLRARQKRLESRRPAQSLRENFSARPNINCASAACYSTLCSAL